MLSKTSIVILGMLRKGEMNAYDMLKMIDRMNMKYWFPIGATTLYETCLRLEKKNYIENTGESDKKAVYKLTESGLKEQFLLGPYLADELQLTDLPFGSSFMLPSAWCNVSSSHGSPYKVMSLEASFNPSISIFTSEKEIIQLPSSSNENVITVK